jgi:hypothetical protein
MIDKRVQADGKVDISFGGPVTGEWQWGTGNPPRGPLTFNDLDNVDSAYQIVIRLTDKAKRA